MSSAVAVFHGAYGRVCLFSNDRAMAPHAHREGHLIFHVEGPPAEMVVENQVFPLSPGQAVAISPLQTHYYTQLNHEEPTLALVLYVRPSWFLEVARRAFSTMRFGRVGIEVTGPLARNVYATARAMIDPDHDDPQLEDHICSLTQAAFDQSWQWTSRGSAFTGPSLPTCDFRIRKALRNLQERVTEPVRFDVVAREAGLSRPHFYELFRAQVGVTPNVYLNTLRMERAIDRLTGSDAAVAEIGLDLGFSSQASFSRFFIANGVVAPSAYRRSAQQMLLQ
jgi:AraC-like DNA-binding protein